MEIRILGPLEVIVEGRRVAPRRAAAARGAGRARAARRRGRAPGSPDRRPLGRARSGHGAARRPRVRLAAAQGARRRRAALETRAPGYVLRVGPDELDLSRFERLLARGRAGARRGSRRARTSASRPRSRCGADRRWPTSPTRAFAQAAVARLDELRVAALEAAHRRRARARTPRGSSSRELEALVASTRCASAARPADARALPLRPPGRRAGRLPARPAPARRGARHRARPAAAGAAAADPAARSRRSRPSARAPAPAPARGRSSASRDGAAIAPLAAIACDLAASRPSADGRVRRRGARRAHGRPTAQPPTARRRAGARVPRRAHAAFTSLDAGADIVRLATRAGRRRCCSSTRPRPARRPAARPAPRRASLDGGVCDVALARARRTARRRRGARPLRRRRARLGGARARGVAGALAGAPLRLLGVDRPTARTRAASWRRLARVQRIVGIAAEPVLGRRDPTACSPPPRTPRSSSSGSRPAGRRRARRRAPRARAARRAPDPARPPRPPPRAVRAPRERDALHLGGRGRPRLLIAS